MAESRSKALEKAKAATKYSLVPLVTDKTPYTTATIKSTIGAAKDLRDWTRRNNPFKPHNGSKDPLVRQMMNTAKQAVKDVKEDLRHGDLTFRNLNRTFMATFGEVEEDMFGDMTDFSDLDFSGYDESDSGGPQEGPSEFEQLGDQINAGFLGTQRAATSATLNAISHATDSLSRSNSAAFAASADRMIAVSMSNTTRISGQIGEVQGGIEAINRNLSSIVEQANGMGTFFGQAQQYMEHTEQSLNDIKALLTEYTQRGTQRTGEYETKELPKFLRDGFDIKEYASHIFNESSMSYMLSAGVGTVLKALKMELPSFIDESLALPLSELNPLKSSIEKLIPNVAKLGEFDKYFQRGIETFFAMLNKGDLKGSIFSIMGQYDMGFDRYNNKRYASGAYNKGAITWNGKSERALQEVIPEYLSSIEANVQLIADHVVKMSGAEDITKPDKRYFDYNSGKFMTTTRIKQLAMKEFNEEAEGAFSSSFKMIEDLIYDNEDAKQRISDLVQKMMDKNHIDEESNEDIHRELFNILAQYQKEDKVLHTFDIKKVYSELYANKNQAVERMNALKSSTAARNNVFATLYDDIGNIALDARVQYLNQSEAKQKKESQMTPEELEEYRKQQAIEEANKSTKEKFDNSQVGKVIKGIQDNLNPLNKMIGYLADSVTGLTIGLFNGLPSYDVGTDYVDSDQVAQIHQGEAILTSQQNTKARDTFGSASAMVDALSDNDKHQMDQMVPGNYDGSTGPRASLASEPGSGKDNSIQPDGAATTESEQAYRDNMDKDTIQSNNILDHTRGMYEQSVKQTAILAQQANAATEEREKAKQEEDMKKFFGTKNDDGFYEGTGLSEYANMALDFKNAVSYALTGKGYKTSGGVEIADAKEGSVRGQIVNALKDGVDSTLTGVFGNTWRENKFFKNVSGSFSRIQSGLKGVAEDDYSGVSSVVHYVEGQDAYEEHMKKNQATTAADNVSGYNVGADGQLSFLGTEDEINDAIGQTSEAALKLNKNLIGDIKGGLFGFLGATAITMGGGLLPKLLCPGGPIGGAILGVGASMLSRNEEFMEHMFGKKGDDGKRVGGVISTQTQERWKGMVKSIMPASAVGALGTFLFPNLTSKVLGGTLTALVGTGPVVGAALAVGGSMILKSKVVQDALYGEEGKGGTTGVVGKLKSVMGDFHNKHKGSLKGLGMGMGAGALTGLVAGAPILGILTLGALGGAVGIKAGSDKFNDFLFGTKMWSTDKDGNTVMTRNGDGLIGKIGRKITVNILNPLEEFARDSSRKFAEWIRHDVGEQIQSIFEPFTRPFKMAFEGIGKGMDALKKGIWDSVKFITSPFRKLAGGLLKGTGKLAVGGLKMGMGLAGNVLSAPLKILGLGGRIASNIIDPNLREHNKRFWAGNTVEETYTDKFGETTVVNKTRKFGRALDMINPVARFKDAKNAFLNSNGSFLDSMGDAVRSFTPWRAYGEARRKYAEENGLENDAAFMGGVNIFGIGAEGNKHWDKVRRDKRQHKKEKARVKLAKQFATEDNYNNKIVLTDEDIKARNELIRKAMHVSKKKYYDENDGMALDNEGIMEFIYGDTFNTQKKKEQEEDKKENEEHESIISIPTAINDLKTVAEGILGYVSGKVKPETPEGEEEEGSDTEGETITPDIGDDQINFDDLDEDQYVDYSNLAPDEDQISFFDTDDTQSSEEPTITPDATVTDNHKPKDEDKDDMAEETIKPSDDDDVDFDELDEDQYVDYSDLADEYDENGKKKLTWKERLKNFRDWANEDITEGDSALAKAARSVKGFLGKKKKGKTAADAEEDEINTDPIPVELPEEQVGKLSFVSSLFGKKGMLAGIGIVAAGAGLVFLLTKFPKMLDWVKETAIPWVKDTLWPFLRDVVGGTISLIGKGVGKLVDKLVHAEEDGELAFSNDVTGQNLTREERRAQIQKAAELGISNPEVMATSLKGQGWFLDLTNGRNDNTAVLADIAGIDTSKEGQTMSNFDYYTAAYSYYANQFLVDPNMNGHELTAPALRAYVSDHDADNFAKGVYKNAKKNKGKLKYAKFNSRIQNADRDAAINKAISYAFGEYGNNVYGLPYNPDYDPTVDHYVPAGYYDEAEESEGGGIGYGHFTQVDPRWAHKAYSRTSAGGYTTMANGGCGPTALANVASQFGIRTNPAQTASLAQRYGYTADGGTTAKMFTSGASRLGLKSTEIGTSGIRKALSSGNKVIFSGKGSGIYTKAGHIMSARGLDNRGNVIVDDPMRRHSISVPMSAIGKGFTHGWSIGRGTRTKEELEKSMKDREDMLNSGYLPSDAYRANKKLLLEDQLEYLDLQKQELMAQSGGRVTDEVREIDDMIRQTQSDLENVDKTASGSVGNEVVNKAVDAIHTTYGVYYVQGDDKWANAKISRPGASGTIANVGCIESSIGTMLANITGLNYRPDMFATNTEGVRGPYVDDSILGMIKKALPDSMRGVTVERYNVAGDTSNDDPKYTNTVPYDNMNFNEFSFGYDAEDEESTARRNMHKALEQSLTWFPFIIHGGTDFAVKDWMPKVSDNGRKPLFYKGYKNEYFSQHAVVAIPQYGKNNMSGGILGQSKYYILDPATQQQQYQGTEYTYSELFGTGKGKDQGIDSIIFLNGLRADDYLVKGTNGAEMVLPGLLTGQEAYTPGSSSSTGADGEAEEEINGSNFMTKLLAKLGELGTIAWDILASVFTGKAFKSSIDKKAWSNIDTAESRGLLSGDNPAEEAVPQEEMITIGGKEVPVSSLAPEAQRDYYLAKERQKEAMYRGANTLIKSAAAGVDSDPNYANAVDIMNFDTLPNWAREFVHVSKSDYITQDLPTSKKLSATDIGLMINTLSKVISVSEAGGDYTGAYNDLGYMSIGINGFHKENAAEIFGRMKKDNTTDSPLTEEEMATASALESKCVEKLYTKNGTKYPDLSNFLAAHPTQNKMIQDAMIQQLQMDALSRLLPLYDDGYVTDPRSIMFMSQFAGLAPARLDEYRRSIMNGRYNGKDKSHGELAMVAKDMDSYYTAYNSTYRDYLTGFRNRFRNIYRAFSGDRNTAESIGYGYGDNGIGYGNNGISNSYHTTSYDIVDTPVAITGPQEVVFDERPITSRIDMIIDLLRRIASMGANPRPAAETASTVGYGFAENQKIQNAGAQREERLPIMTDRDGRTDKLRAIHDAIAKSPRST